MSTIELQRFIEMHKPSPTTIPAGQPLIDRYRGRLPQCLLELWSISGLGFYSDGLICLVNPDRYTRILSGWLMREENDMPWIPIALSAFGTIFYYRKLSEEGDEDVAFLDPHNSDTDVLAWSLDLFFNDWLCDASQSQSVLETDLFRQAARKWGLLKPHEIFCFAPALRLGGTRDLVSIERGDALVHLDYLLQLALEA